MKQKFISTALVITMVFALLSSFSFTANAAEISATTNKYTYIRMAPYWTAEVVDELTSGYNITILEREYTYLYIQYTKNGVIKCGYMPKADTNATGYSWCQHGEYNSGYNSTAYAQTVYYQPGGTSCGTIDANEGEVDNKPLLVLRTEGSYAFIQYVTNTSNDGSAHVLFKRGWVPTSVITVNKANSVTEVLYRDMVYIKNVATGKYLDLQSYSAGNVNGGNIHIWDFHGSYNQEWKLLPITSNGATYIKLATNQGTQNRVIRIAEATAVVGNSAELYTQGDPSKDQEFVLEKAGEYYQIKARCSGNFMVLGVNPGDSGTGGEVYLRYPDGSDYNKWELIPTYRENVEYVKNSYKLTSSIENGITASFNLNNVPNKIESGSTKWYTRTYSEQAITSWNYINSNIVLSFYYSDPALQQNNIIWDKDLELDPIDDSEIFGRTVEDYDGSINITIYYGSIDKVYKNNIDVALKSVLAHEVGHALGLDHPKYQYNTLMHHRRDRTILIAPTMIDIAGVKKNYCNK